MARRPVTVADWRAMLVDPDPAETREWVDTLDSVLAIEMGADGVVELTV